ncbi:MAG TPA: patatin-like phospholipase family protein [Longimicrobiales bacterium]|nr:patatin-like phospholipase family protein [Longimicrobiales bacterium]
MARQFRNLVFEGGGVKGIAYVGAMQVLEQRGHLTDIRRVGGTSAGAINALIVSLGYSNAEQLDLLNSVDFRRFMDNSFGVFRDTKRLLNEFGWNKGDFFRGWAGDLITAKLGSRRATFADLRDAGLPELYVVGTNLSTGYAEVFSAERHEAMPLAEALRISMSIPLFFAAVRHGARNDVYVDGGVQLNYPVKLFDRLKYIDAGEPDAVRRTGYYDQENEAFLRARPNSSPYVYNRQTLGLRLDTQDEIGLYRYDEPLDGKPITRLDHYARSLMQALMNAQEHVHLHGDDWQRTVYINTLDVRTTDFDITDSKKLALLQEGVNGAQTYFRWFDDPAEKPVNRVRRPGEPLGTPVEVRL